MRESRARDDGLEWQALSLREQPKVGVPPTDSRGLALEPDAPAARPVAVLDMGATAIRLLVAEVPPEAPPVILEEASRAVLLGKDAFTAGRLGSATIEATLRALEGFR